MRIIRNVFISLFPIFMLIVIIRYFVQAQGDFDLNLYVTYLKNNFNVDFEYFVNGIKKLTSILKGMNWVTPYYNNTQGFFEHSNVLTQIKFFSQFSNFFEYFISLITNYVKNIFTILYAIFGYLYYVVYYLISILLDLMEFTIYVFGMAT